MANFLKKLEVENYYAVVGYEAEHTLGLDDAIDDLKQVCIKNGGNIKWYYTMARI